MKWWCWMYLILCSWLQCILRFDNEHFSANNMFIALYYSILLYLSPFLISQGKTLLNVLRSCPTRWSPDFVSILFAVNNEILTADANIGIYVVWYGQIYLKGKNKYLGWFINIEYPVCLFRYQVVLLSTTLSSFHCTYIFLCNFF